MARANIPLLAFNRGIISKLALGRVDLDKTRLSAEVMTNWLPKTQGGMRIRPGTKYFGSSLNDSGAEFIEFAAATNQVALLELTDDTMRSWQGSDAHNLSLLERPSIATTLTLTDTGWDNNSTGGTITSGSATDILPSLFGYTSGAFTLSVSSEEAGEGFPGWYVCDNNPFTFWADTGVGNVGVPSWVNANFGSATSPTSYSVRCYGLSVAPRSWRIITSNYDTGTYATDTGKWTLQDERIDEKDWAAYERRLYTLPDADTGTVGSASNWRFYFTATDTGVGTDTRLFITELEMFTAASALQAKVNGGRLTLNALTTGGLAKYQKRVFIDTGDQNVEHSLSIRVDRGPVTLRCGSSNGDDDYISETTLGTGYHNLAFTPISSYFYVTVQSDKIVDRIVGSLTIGDTGTVTITTPWSTETLDDIRYDQSADVVYVDNASVRPHKIERRGTGRSWSVVEYQPDDGPFVGRTSTAKLSLGQTYGNTTLTSDVPFFKAEHSGALVRAFHPGQSGRWILGAENTVTDAIKMTGINDTGVTFNDTGTTRAQERQIQITTSGTFSANITVQRSFDGPDTGFHDTDVVITSATTTWINDNDDNLTVWYRLKIKDGDYTSGAAIIDVVYGNGGVTGICRVTGYQSNTVVDVEVLSRFSSTDPTTDWEEGAWSGVRGYPDAVALHEGRLAHAGGANVYLSVADAYESFDDTTIGDAGPISRTLGSGPVDNIYYLISLIRLIAGTAGAEIALRSSSLDEPLTPSNSSAKTFSTQGSANLRALSVDSQAFFVQRSSKRVFSIGFGESSVEYQSSELTYYVPDLLEAGVVSIAVQRQPDTRLHCVLANGKVAILTFEPAEQVLCWSMWETNGTVERAMTLPGTDEDAVYYHVNRTINGVTKRYLEKWPLESECNGDTGLSWLADCAASYTAAGRTATVTGFSHLIGESIIGWSDDTGQTMAGKDLTPDDTGGDQVLLVVDTGGAETLSEAVHHFVGGLPYTADYTSSKLAYAAQAGTALVQMKRSDKIGFVLYQTHNNGLFFGRDTGALDPLPRKSDEGGQVDGDKIFTEFDDVAMPFPGLWDADSRIHLRAKAPRPVTVLAAVPTVGTHEKI